MARSVLYRNPKFDSYFVVTYKDSFDTDELTHESCIFDDGSIYFNYRHSSDDCEEIMSGNFISCLRRMGDLARTDKLYKNCILFMNRSVYKINREKTKLRTKDNYLNDYFLCFEDRMACNDKGLIFFIYTSFNYLDLERVQEYGSIKEAIDSPYFTTNETFMDLL